MFSILAFVLQILLSNFILSICPVLFPSLLPFYPPLLSFAPYYFPLNSLTHLISPYLTLGEMLSPKGLFDFVRDSSPGEITNLRLAGAFCLDLKSILIILTFILFYFILFYLFLDFHVYSSNYFHHIDLYSSFCYFKYNYLSFQVLLMSLKFIKFYYISFKSVHLILFCFHFI